MNHKKLTDEDLKLLRATYGRFSNNEIAQAFGISEKYVEFLCTHYDLHKDTDYMFKIRQPQGNKTAMIRWKKSKS